MEKDYILVGKISGAHGLKGGLNILSFAEETDLFSPGSFVYVKNNRSGDYELFETKSVSKKKNHILLVRFEGVDGRDKAEDYKGREIFIKKKSLPDTDDDTWYWHDLIGMDVFEEDGSELGRVKNLMRTGSSDILEVKKGQKEILIPFLKSVIISVSLEDSRIMVKLPEGLTD